MLLGFIIINLANIQHSSSLTATIATIISDIRSQQTKAMIGATEGRTAADSYGIYFSTNSYTLFHGLSYRATDSANLVVPLDSNIQITNITLPNQDVIFLQQSGELSGYIPGSSSVTVSDNQAKIQKVIIFNRYGAIVSVQ